MAACYFSSLSYLSEKKKKNTTYCIAENKRAFFKVANYMHLSFTTVDFSFKKGDTTCAQLLY